MAPRLFILPLTRLRILGHLFSEPAMKSIDVPSRYPVQSQGPDEIYLLPHAIDIRRKGSRRT